MTSHISTTIRPVLRRPTIFAKANSISEPEIPLDKLIPSLPHLHQLFFSKLAAELEKVDEFYKARERDVLERSKLLDVQLKELQLHRRLYYVRGLIAHSKPSISCQNIGSKS